MMQPKRPISRSSTPIEFAPLVLDLDPEVKNEPKGKRGAGIFSLVIVAAAVLLGILCCFSLKKTAVEGHVNNTTKIDDSNVVTPNVPSITPTNGTESGIKKTILLQGATNAKLVLENVGGEDVLRVAINDKVDEGVSWKYEWTNNGQPFGQGDSIRGFKRGDLVAVKIMPFDGENWGKPKVLTTEIRNSAPRIVGDKATVSFDGKGLVYQINATDPDGDSLTYALIEGPQGATIDAQSGIISWPTNSENQPKPYCKVKISDGHGGEVVYPLTVKFFDGSDQKLTGKS